MKLERKSFGTTAGKEVEEFIVDNGNGLIVSLISYGALLRSLRFPDRNGASEELVLGFDSLDRYLQNNPFFGATVGRFANRIAGASFEIDGKKYHVTKSEGNNQLHGGLKGFDKVVWTAEPFSLNNEAGVVFSYLSPDGEEGFPGNLKVSVKYTVTATNSLLIEYNAETDATTPVNLTNHSYWNLRGAGSGNVFDQVLFLNASRYLPIDDESIPVGEITPVAGTPMDFTLPKKIGKDFGAAKSGYDHCFVLDGKTGTLNLAAEVHDPVSGRVLRIFATQPGIQFYSSNFLTHIIGSEGRVFEQYGAFCLETENFP